MFTFELIQQIREGRMTPAEAATHTDRYTIEHAEPIELGDGQIIRDILTALIALPKPNRTSQTFSRGWTAHRDDADSRAWADRGYGDGDLS